MIILSGPSTIGKNPLINEICNQFNYNFIIPTTTRKARTEEENGVDYFFRSKAEFRELITNRTIIEWDYTLGNYYGYEYDFNKIGAKTVTHGLSRMTVRNQKKYGDNLITVFLKPKKIDTIWKRLDTIYTGEDLVLRRYLVAEELEHMSMFDFIFEIENKATELMNNEQFMKIIRGAK